MRIVLDTHVLVSGLLSPFGTCGELVRMLTTGTLVLCVDARILLEYDEVLRRSKFDIEPARVDLLMEHIVTTAEVHAADPLDVALPDVADSPFLEVALASAANFLVTGNLKHFPEHLRAGACVVSPRAFIEEYRALRTRRP